MKKEEFVALINEQAGRLLKLTHTKGREYARSDDDQLANFKRQGKEFGMLPEQVLAVYLNKHLDSIKTHIKDMSSKVGYAQEPSEPIDGRIDDAILYLILLKALLIERVESDILESKFSGGMSLDQATAPMWQELKERRSQEITHEGHVQFVKVDAPTPTALRDLKMFNSIDPPDLVKRGDIE